MTSSTHAPELLVQTWFNTERPLLLSGLRGRIVVLAAFQVLCPNSISGGIPQARRIYETFEPKDVAVIGLHAPLAQWMICASAPRSALSSRSWVPPS
jgi:hypothetical protein